MSKKIGYHTRLENANSCKVTGGSFGGAIDQETVERLVNVHFSVRIKPSGRAVFVDKQDREVSLYITVDPLSTEKGKQALRDWRTEANKKAYLLSNCNQKSISLGVFTDCASGYSCCDCGGQGCGCGGCFSCNACEACREEE